MVGEETNDSISRAFNSKNTEALEKQYQDWAPLYDAENAAAGFRLPALAPGFFARYVPLTDQPVLDAGCGTGLAGDNLHILGYRNLTGIDISENMLKIADRLGVYSNLIQMTLGEYLNFPDNHFSAVISTGVFTEGHAPHSSFDELIRITKTGGYIVFNVRDDIYQHQGFRGKQHALAEQGVWQLVEKSDRFRPYTITEQDVVARIFVYQVT